MLCAPCLRALFSGVGVQRLSLCCLGPHTTPVEMEDRLLALFGGELPNRFVARGEYFDVIQAALSSLDEGDLPADLYVDIPTPILHCVLG